MLLLIVLKLIYFFECDFIRDVFLPTTILSSNKLSSSKKISAVRATTMKSGVLKLVAFLSIIGNSSVFGFSTTRKKTFLPPSPLPKDD